MISFIFSFPLGKQYPIRWVPLNRITIMYNTFTCKVITITIVSYIGLIVSCHGNKLPFRDVSSLEKKEIKVNISICLFPSWE